MKFGIITPVFDGCLDALDRLFADVMGQTHDDWAWIICSNGYSEKISALAREKNRMLHPANKDLVWRIRNGTMPKIAYLWLDNRKTSGPWELLKELGRRRDYCIRKIHADYIFMLDADAKLLDRDMFRIVDERLRASPKDVCVYRVDHEVGMLPVFPIGYGRIDMLNFCVKASLAKRIGYPTDIEPGGVANDYRFFDRAMQATGGDYLFIDRLFGQHNGNNNNSYINIMRQIAGE